MALLYGVDYRFKNGYDDWRGGYLDGDPRNRTVFTGNYNQTLNNQTDGLTSVWYLLSATGKKTGDPVLTNDVIHFQNRGGGYLETQGRGCNGNLLCVSISPTQPGAPATQWKIQLTKSDGESAQIEQREGFHLLNGWDDWKGGYLDTRGYATGYNFAGNVPLLLSVSTRDGWDGVDSPQTTLWWAER